MGELAAEERRDVLVAVALPAVRQCKLAPAGLKEHHAMFSTNFDIAKSIVKRIAKRIVPLSFAPVNTCK